MTIQEQLLAGQNPDISRLQAAVGLLRLVYSQVDKPINLAGHPEYTNEQYNQALQDNLFLAAWYNHMCWFVRNLPPELRDQQYPFVPDEVDDEVSP